MTNADPLVTTIAAALAATAKHALFDPAIMSLDFAVRLLSRGLFSCAWVRAQSLPCRFTLS